MTFFVVVVGVENLPWSSLNKNDFEGGGRMAGEGVQKDACCSDNT